MGESAPLADQARHDAFATHVLPQVEVLLRAAGALTRNQADAEDLVQDTLLRAYRAIDRFDGRHPRAWLLTIMRNAQVNRTRRRRPELLRDPDDTNDPVDTSEAGGDPQALVVGRTFEAVVASAYAALPERHRQLVRLVDMEGLSYREAASVLGIPVGTVMSGLHRARARIRRRLAAADLAPRRPRP